ncbi:MAG: metallopeptidase TldD-related protein, partial [Prolixibacteraceae bacterium]|nr:metallopeptidase TldD-related protein [Prolixibacteraceae bacterium]
MKRIILLFFMPFLVQHGFAQDELVEILKNEINRNFAVMSEQPVPAYYISYRVYDIQGYAIQSSFGDISNINPNNRNRIFDVVTRVGNHQLDNTRELSGNMGGGITFLGGMSSNLPLDNNAEAIQMALWQKTDQQYKNAVKRYENVKANTAIMVAAEDKSDDFTVEKPERYYEKPVAFETVLPDMEMWENKIKSYSKVFAENKTILHGTASFEIELTRKYFVNTEGSEIVENRVAYRISISAGVIADDGMNLPLFKSWFAHDIKDLPSDAQVIAAAKEISDLLVALREAPVAESFSGPALMTAEAAGVFFHEIFGHRIEGARLKKEFDAQTFKKKVGEMVLPTDISVIFDPQLKKYKGIPLNGDYKFDDEGVRGQRVEVVKDGILRQFLMSRTPIDGFPNSNGHGRAAIQLNTVTRQSNMIIESTSPKTQKQLRDMLIDEAKKTGKE